jgi:hypothetical protein
MASLTAAAAAGPNVGDSGHFLGGDELGEGRRGGKTTVGIARQTLLRGGPRR